GFQSAVAYNAVGDLFGMQLALAANRARVVSGLQLAAAANLADDVHGVQFGLVNVGRRVSGLQFGLVNVADSSSASVGLFNFISDGIHDVAGQYSELGPSLVLRLGGQRVYTVISVGETNYSTVPGVSLGKSGILLIGLGLGIHSQIRTWSIDNEALASRGYGGPEGAHLLTTYRLVLGAPLAGNVRFVFGPSVNALFDFDNKLRRLGYGWSLSLGGNTQLKLWPGAFAGIRF